MKNLAVLVSGSGTNLENLAVKIEKGELKNCKIALVVCDNPEAFALKRAANHQIRAVVIVRKNFDTRENFEKEILKELAKYKIDYIVLAGYMRILGKNILEKYKWKIINVHPAFLPNFPGAHAIRDCWEANVPETGVTVHLVDEGIDSGPIILQKKVKRLSSDTIESLEKKIHEVEYEIYPKAIQQLVDGRLSVKNSQAHLDGKPLTALVQ